MDLTTFFIAIVWPQRRLRSSSWRAYGRGFYRGNAKDSEMTGSGNALTNKMKRLFIRHSRQDLMYYTQSCH
jgi:hypothetical protein